MLPLDHARCYRAVLSRDRRFDGCFVSAVATTGIYCRPSCPAVTPKPANVAFLATAAAAQQRGFRACKRCRPDAAPGSPEWNLRADLAVPGDVDGFLALRCAAPSAGQAQQLHDACDSLSEAFPLPEVWRIHGEEYRTVPISPEALFRAMIKFKASDIHLYPGATPVFRVDSVMRRVQAFEALDEFRGGQVGCEGDPEEVGERRLKAEVGGDLRVVSAST